MSLADRLRQARQEADMTQQRAAELTGLEPHSIWRYENGHREPSASILNRLGSLYGKPVEWFFIEDIEEPVPDADYEVDLDLVMNEASLALRLVSDRLSPEAIKAIASYIRFVHEEEERERRESQRQG